jgi:hypothetical protein
MQRHGRKNSARLWAKVRFGAIKPRAALKNGFPNESHSQMFPFITEVLIMTTETYKTSATFNASFSTEAAAFQKRTATLKLWLTTDRIDLVEDSMRLAKKHDDDMVSEYKARLGL